MPDETVIKNSIKIFSSKYMADLSYDIESAYVLNFNFITTFKSELKKVFDRDEPILLKEPLESISGDFTIVPSGLNSVLACLSNADTGTLPATSPQDLNEFHIVANCYDPAAENNFIGYYCGFCRIKQIPQTDMSSIDEPLKFKFTGGILKTAFGAFDAFNVAGTNSANQQVPFNFTPVLFESRYAVKVFKDDTLLIKDTDYTEDAAKITVINAVPTTSKITVVYIYNPI